MISNKHHEITAYTFEYSYILNDYQTSEGIAITITDYGEISFFTHNPYLFDDVDIKAIDEQDLLKQLDEIVRRDNKDSLVDYEVEMKQLSIDENKNLVMEFHTIINFTVISQDGVKDTFTKGVAYQIKV